jgi:hypothetical protein
MLSAAGARVTDDFQSSVLAIPMPETVGELRSFIGSANWTRSSVPGLAQLLAPLQALVDSAIASLPPHHRTSKTRVARLRLCDFGWDPAVHGQAAHCACDHLRIPWCC